MTSGVPGREPTGALGRRHVNTFEVLVPSLENFSFTHRVLLPNEYVLFPHRNILNYLHYQ